MKRAPQIAFLADGRRLHLQDGPIDLIVEAYGTRQTSVRPMTPRRGALRDCSMNCARSCRCCARRPIRRDAHCKARSRAACMKRWRHSPPIIFITPMAAVAGSVAEEILGAMLYAAQLERAYVNNGGDIALHLADGEHFTVGLAERPDAPGLMRTMIINAMIPREASPLAGATAAVFP